MQIEKVTNLISQKALKPASEQIRIVPKFSFEPDYYLIKLGRKVIGNTSFKVNGFPETYKKMQESRFPQNWYNAGKMKPHLDISYIEILREKGKGFGRKAVQALYQISRKEGCEGRMIFDAIPTSAGFYSHLGFDCSVTKQSKYKPIYDKCMERAQNGNLKKRAFNALLRNSGCPTVTNGKFNIAGIRFFDPIKENIDRLFKS